MLIPTLTASLPHLIVEVTGLTNIIGEVGEIKPVNRGQSLLLLNLRSATTPIKERNDKAERFMERTERQQGYQSVTEVTISAPVQGVLKLLARMGIGTDACSGYASCHRLMTDHQVPGYQMDRYDEASPITRYCLVRSHNGWRRQKVSPKSSSE